MLSSSLALLCVLSADGYMANAGFSLGAFGEGHLRPSASVEVTGSAAIAWASVGARMNVDQFSPYGELGLYLLANVGMGLSRIPGKGAVPHGFVGLPISNFSREEPMFFEPYFRHSFGSSDAWEFGLMVKTVFLGGQMLGSCPHVYSDDGGGERIDADMLSGSFYPEAESDDWDRLEHLAAKDDVYRVRIANDRQEQDYLNKVALLAVDHAPEKVVLPSSQGGLAELHAPVPPARAVDGQGHDERPALAAADDHAWSGHPLAHDGRTEAAPEDTLEIELPRPTDPGMPYLVVRVRNTDEATEAMYRYLGAMGPGAARLMRATGTATDIRRRVGEEIDRLGLPLRVSVRAGKEWIDVDRLRPVGPAAARFLAVPLPAGTSPTVAVRLTISPGVWAIDQVAIAAGTSVRAAPVPIRSAIRGADDVAPALAAVDEDRVRLDTGDSVALTFAAPPVPAGRSRSLFLHLHGYYEVSLGNGLWLNPIAIYRHRMGTDSAPRFFLRTLREKP